MITNLKKFISKKVSNYKLKNLIKNDNRFQDWYMCLPEDIRQKIDTLDQYSVWHPESFLVNHLYLIFRYIIENFDGDVDLLCACFLHDLGKIDTYKYSNGKPSFRGHEDVKYIEKYMNLYFDKFYSKFYISKEKVKEICENHMRAHMYNDGSMSRKSKREVFENLKYFKDIIKFAEADEKSKQLIWVI